MSPTTALVAGAAAGLAVAMPLGAIGLLILEAAIRRGLRPGIAAGAGVAAADLTYAVVAACAAAPIAVALAPHARELHLVAGAVAGSRLSERARTVTTLAGAAVVVVLAVRAVAGA